MRKLILFNMVTADGYFEGQRKDISWHRVDEEVNEFMIAQLKTAGLLLFGRKTFEVMEGFWPSESAFEQNPEVAGMMKSYTKIVFSTTREKTTWENTKWYKENAAEEVDQMKRQESKNIFVFGSATLCKVLIKNNLIDEFRLMVNPVTLGKGRPFFYRKISLALLKTKVFGNGNVLLCYRNNNLR